MECRYNHENQEHRTLNIDDDEMSVLPCSVGEPSFRSLSWGWGGAVHRPRLGWRCAQAEVSSQLFSFTQRRAEFSVIFIVVLLYLIYKNLTKYYSIII